MCALSWVLDRQSCEVSKTFDPLLLDMMADALCSYHFSKFGCGNHVFSDHVDSFPKASDFAGCFFFFVCSRGLVMVQVWHWYVKVGTKMEFMILLFVSVGIFGCIQSWGKLIADIVGLLYRVFNFHVHSTIFCEYTAKTLELFDLETKEESEDEDDNVEH